MEKTIKISEVSASNELSKSCSKEGELVIPGAILDCSWGWGMTNVNFYEVIKRTEKFVTLQKIGKIKFSSPEAGGWYGYCTADSSINIGKPFRKKIDKNGHVKFHDIRSYASYWNGSPLSFNDLD